MQSRCRNKKWAKQKGLKIPLFWQRSVLGSCTRFSFGSFYCVGFGLAPRYGYVFDRAPQPQRSARVISAADRFCLRGKKKKKRKWDGPKWTRGGYLLLANRHRPHRWCTHFAFVAWQLAFIPWHHCVCSHCDLLLNLICALKLLAASRLDGGIRKRNSPPARLCFERDGESVLQCHWSGLNWYKWTCFSLLPTIFCEAATIPFRLSCFNAAVRLHLIYWRFLFFCFFIKPKWSPCNRVCPFCAAWTYFA